MTEPVPLTSEEIEGFRVWDGSYLMEHSAHVRIMATIDSLTAEKERLERENEHQREMLTRSSNGHKLSLREKERLERAVKPFVDFWTDDYGQRPTSEDYDALVAAVGAREADR